MMSITQIALILILLLNIFGASAANNNLFGGGVITSEDVTSEDVASANQQTDTSKESSDSHTNVYSSQDSYYNIYPYQQSKENVFFIRSIPDRREYLKNDKITMIVGVQNENEYPIYNVTINDEIPVQFLFGLNGIETSLNNGIETSLNISSPKASQIYKPKMNGKYTIDFSLINKSEYKYLKIYIKSDQSGKYILSPATLSYKNQAGENVSINSQQSDIDVINRGPRVTQIQITPNPAKKLKGSKFCENISLKANFTDPDENDLDRWEIWSSIDGLRGSGKINNTNKSSLSVSIDNLSEGDHTITFKVFDKDDETSSESLALTVDEYIFNTIPEKYDWTIFLMFIAILVEIILRDGCEKLKETEVIVAIGIFLLFLILADYIHIILPLYLYLITFVSLAAFIIYLCIYFKLNN